MPNFKKELTSDGAELLAKCISGGELRFTAILLGDGENDGQLSEQHALIHECMRLPLTRITRKGSEVSLRAAMKYADVTADGFRWRELGVAAVDPDSGSEVLYSYGYDAVGDSIPGAGSANLLDRIINVKALVSTAANVTAVVDSSLVYLTQAELDAHDTDPDAHWMQMSQKADLGLDGKVIPEQLPGLDYEPLGAVAAHNVSPDAHTALFAAVNARLATAEAEIAGITHNLYDPITGNPHTYTFDSLTGIKIVSGCWNKPQARLEC